MKQKLKDSFLYAFRRSMPIMIGYFALGSANGILMAQKGYSVGLTGIASLFIYAGTQQMLLSGWLAAGTPILTIAITSLLLNSRHLFFGISFWNQGICTEALKLMLDYCINEKHFENIWASERVFF